MDRLSSYGVEASAAPASGQQQYAAIHSGLIAGTDRQQAYREALEPWRVDKAAGFPLGTWWVVQRAGAALAQGTFEHASRAGGLARGGIVARCTAPSATRRYVTWELEGRHEALGLPRDGPAERYAPVATTPANAPTSASPSPSPLHELHGVSAVATRSGAAVSIASGPAPLALDLPSRWLDRYASSGNNIHVTPAELAAVHEGAGEWDSAYGAVVNAVLPFEGCALHAGGDGWGTASVAYTDVQMRAYLVSEPPVEVLARFAAIAESALAEAGGSNLRSTSTPAEPWARTAVTATLSFGDYGGHATVDLRIQRRRDDTLVLAFMYSGDHEPTIQSILSSVRP